MPKKRGSAARGRLKRTRSSVHSLEQVVAAELADHASTEVNYFNSKRVAKEQARLASAKRAESIAAGDTSSVTRLALPSETAALASVAAQGEKATVKLVQVRIESYLRLLLSCPRRLFVAWCLHGRGQNSHHGRLRNACAVAGWLACLVTGKSNRRV